MSTWIVEKADGRRVTVERDKDTITVKWLCGGIRSFTPDGLEAALTHFELISGMDVSRSDGAVAEIWFRDVDSTENRYACVLRDGDFHADDDVNGRGGSVPWSEFREALRQSIAKPRRRAARAKKS